MPGAINDVALTVQISRYHTQRDVIQKLIFAVSEECVFAAFA